MELDARIARPHKRMAAGDPDITPDELRAALDRAEYKRRELAHAKPTDSSEGSKLLTILPNAAELYRRQIALGLDGAHPQMMLKARPAQVMRRDARSFAARPALWGVDGLQALDQATSLFQKRRYRTRG
jgi:hypothetical protein